MSWEHPIALALIPPALSVVWWMFRRPGRAQDATRYGNIRRLWADRRGLSEHPAATRRRVRGWLLAFGALGTLLALARPQWGTIEETSYEHAREVLLALDLSRSMLADDVSPTRLGRAKLLTESLLDQLRGERVGLVVFAGTAFVQSPLSADYEVLRDFLTELDPSYLPQGGTNYEAMLHASTKAFGQTGDGNRFLVVLSDGEAHDEGWKSFIPVLRRQGIRVIGLGVGTPQGALLPDAAGGFLKDEHGGAVLSRLEPATLQELAKQTGGAYRDAATWVDIAELVNATVEQGKKGNYVEQKSVRLRDQYQWFLAPAVLCWLLSYWLEFPLLPVTRVLRQRRQLRSPAAAAPVVATLLMFLAWQLPRAAAAEGKPSALETTVSELSARPHLAGDDYARLATETIAFASQSNVANASARLGVIDDALNAVDRGETLDPKAADWRALRHQLEQLKQARKEAPNQNEQEQKQADQPQNQGGTPRDQQQGQGGGQPQQNSQGEEGTPHQNAGPPLDQNGNQSQEQQHAQQSGEGKADRDAQPRKGAKNDAHDEANGAADRTPNSQDDRQSGGAGDAQAQPQHRQQATAQTQSQPRDDDTQRQAAAAPREVQRREAKPLDSADAGLSDLQGENQPRPADDQPRASKPPTRLVGGGRALPGAPQGDVALTEALGKMEHVKDGDAPAVLFDRMNQADGARPPEKSAKNW